MTDGPQGPNTYGRSTHYSAMINLAATFNTDLMFEVANNMGKETRVFGRNMLLGPNLNILRVPHNGRTFETFGEDPYLTSRMGVNYIKGVQSENVVSSAKHFVANALNRIVDRSIQVHGALGYSTDTPLAHMFQHARWARFADGADEIHQMQIATRAIKAWQADGSLSAALGDLPL